MPPKDTLAGDLTPHPFNLRPDEFDVRHVRLSDSKRERVLS